MAGKGVTGFTDKERVAMKESAQEAEDGSAPRLAREEGGWGR